MRQTYGETLNNREGKYAKFWGDCDKSYINQYYSVKLRNIFLTAQTIRGYSMGAENFKGVDKNKKIVIIANFATDRVNGAYIVIENIAVHTNKLGYKCEIWGLSTGKDNNDYPFYVHFPLTRFDLPEDLKNKLIAERDSILCVNLHSVFTPVNTVLSKFVKSLNIPLFLTPQGGYHAYTFKRNYFKKKLFFLLFEKSHLKRIDYFFTHGKMEADFIGKYSSKPCYTLLNGFPQGRITSSVYDHQSATQAQTLKILYLGRLDPLHKGLDLLIESMSHLRGKGVELTLAGPPFDEVSQKYLLDLINKLDLAEVVTIKPPVYKQEEKEILFAGHHLFVHSSRWEGMPGGVIEALCYGLPVLVSKGTNMGEIVTKEQFGLVIDKLTPNGIADMITEILANRPRLSEFSNNAYARAPQLFDWNKIAKEYAEYCYSSFGK